MGRSQEEREQLAGEGRRTRGGRASEAERWERRESRNEEGLDEDVSGFDDLEDQEESQHRGSSRL